MSIYKRKVKVKAKETMLPDVQKISAVTASLKNYRRPIVYGISIVVLLIISWQGFNIYQRMVTNDISNHIYMNFKNLSVYSENSEKVDELQTYLADKRTSDSFLASIRLGAIYLREHRFSEAYKLYERVSQKAQNSLLLTMSFLGMGNSLEGKGNYEEARKFFEKAKAMNKSEQFNFISDISIARCFEENGKISEALGHYKKIKEAYTDTSAKGIDYKINKLSLLSG